MAHGSISYIKGGNIFTSISLYICISIWWLFFTIYVAYPDEFVDLFQFGKPHMNFWDNLYDSDLALIKRGHFTILFLVALDTVISLVLRKIDIGALGLAFCLFFVGLFCEAIVDSKDSITILIILGLIVVTMKFISLFEVSNIEKIEKIKV
jgi:hypothetical protein